MECAATSAWTGSRVECTIGADGRDGLIGWYLFLPFGQHGSIANPRLPLISEAAFFNLSNIVDIYPSVTIKPIPSITVMAGPDFLWRHASADGVYIGPSGSAFAAYSGGRAIGTDYNLEASWQTTDRLSFRLFETYFAPGKAFAAAGGKKGNDFGVMSNCRF